MSEQILRNNTIDNDNGASQSDDQRTDDHQQTNVGGETSQPQANTDTSQSHITTSQSFDTQEILDENQSAIARDNGATNTFATQLLERNVKQIQIKEVSTVEKVIKTREVKHISPTGEQTTVSYSKDEHSAFHGTSHDSKLSQNAPRSNDHGSISRGVNIGPYNAAAESTQSKMNSGIPTRFDEALQQEKNQSSQYFSHDNNYGSARATANAYQNYPTGANTASDQLPSSAGPPMPPMRRSSSKVHNQNPPPSGYDELDSTLGYTPNQSNINYEHQQPQQTLMQQSPYGYINKQTGQIIVPMQTVNNHIPMNQAQRQDMDPYDPYGRIAVNDLGFLDQRPTYDTAYGTAAGPSSSMPTRHNVNNTQGIYGQSGQSSEPMYASRGAISGAQRHIQPVVEQIATSDSQIMDIRWRDPDLNEVIQFLNNSNPAIRANAAAYLQHLSYMDDGIKQQTRLLGGIPILINLLECDVPEVQRNTCGALKNLSYGRQNDENKLAIREAGGVQSLVKALVNTLDNEMMELITSILWNLSSCEEIKWSIIDDALSAIVNIIILPHTLWCKANIDTRPNVVPNANELRAASGILRNISSAGAYARKQLRECEGLVESLLTIIKVALSRNDVNSKLVENCVCILRNLSYRCQEVQDPDYDKNLYPNSDPNNSTQNSPTSPSNSLNLASSFVGQLSSKMGDNLGCFGIGRRSRSKSNTNNATAGSSRVLTEQGSSSSTASTLPLNDTFNRLNSSDHSESQKHILMPPHHHMNQTNSKILDKSATLVRTSTQIPQMPVNQNSNSTLPRQMTSNSVNITSFISGPNSNLAPRGKELLWQPDVVKPYLSLLSECSNSETLEAAAGAIQNLSACYWQPSVEIRAAVRKEKGLPVLVELLKMDPDRVVCAVATALRNLAIDQRNKELIGKYAMQDLISKLPNGEANHDLAASDETIAAVLATLNEVISKNSDFARSLFEAGGIDRLSYIIKNRAKFSVRVQRFAAQVLLNMWNFIELREIYKKAGWKEANFIVRNLNKNSTYSIYSNTIDRPMSSQQSDKRTSTKRAVSSGALDAISGQSNHVIGHVQVQNAQSPYGTMHMVPVHSQVPDLQMAPVYAQVNRDKKRMQQSMTNVTTPNGLVGISSTMEPENLHHEHINHSQMDPIYSISPMQQAVNQQSFVNKQIQY